MSPPVVLMPGLDGSGLLYSGLQRELAGRLQLTVVGYDSRRPQKREELLSVAAGALPRSGQAILVGESFSGPLAITLAHRFPGRVAQLVLLASFCRRPTPLLRAAEPILPLLLGIRAPRRFMELVMMGRGADREEIVRAREAMRRVARPVVRSRIQMLNRIDVRAELSELHQPIHYVRGGADRVIRGHRQLAVLRRANHTVVEHLIPDGPHLLATTRPREVARVLCAIAGAEGPGRGRAAGPGGAWLGEESPGGGDSGSL